MEFYEYIVMFEDDEPSKEEVMKAIAEESWNFFQCPKEPRESLEQIAERIVKAKYNDWEMWDEDEHVYLIVRECGAEEWELHKATICYRMYIDTEKIFLDDEEEMM